MNKRTYKVEKLSGIQVVDEFRKLDECSVTIIPLDESGNFRLLITKDDSLFYDVTLNEISTIPLFKGSYKMIIVGESTKYNLEYTFK